MQQASWLGEFAISEEPKTLMQKKRNIFFFLGMALRLLHLLPILWLYQKEFKFLFNFIILNFYHFLISKTLNVEF